MNQGMHRHLLFNAAQLLQFFICIVALLTCTGSTAFTLQISKSLRPSYSRFSLSKWESERKSPTAASRSMSSGEKPVEQTMEELDQALTKCLDSSTRFLQSIKSGKASFSLIERVLINQQGNPVRLNRLAAVNTVNATTFRIEAFEKRLSDLILKSIQVEDLGTAICSDTGAIFLTVSPPTKESRESIARKVTDGIENARIAIRGVRRTFLERLKKMEKNGTLGIDASKSIQSEVNKKASKSIEKLDKLMKNKIKEVLLE